MLGPGVPDTTAENVTNAITWAGLCTISMRRSVVGELAALGVRGQVQHAHGLVVVQVVQDRVFTARCLSQFGQDG